jgi:hypothetical protein
MAFAGHWYQSATRPRRNDIRRALILVLIFAVVFRFDLVFGCVFVLVDVLVVDAKSL